MMSEWCIVLQLQSCSPLTITAGLMTFVHLPFKQHRQIEMNERTQENE